MIEGIEVLDEPNIWCRQQAAVHEQVRLDTERRFVDLCEVRFRPQGVELSLDSQGYRAARAVTARSPQHVVNREDDSQGHEVSCPEGRENELVALALKVFEGTRAVRAVPTKKLRELAAEVGDVELLASLHECLPVLNREAGAVGAKLNAVQREGDRVDRRVHAPVSYLEVEATEGEVDVEHLLS